MKILFYLGHPAHFHLFKNVIHNLKEKGHLVDILIKNKEILEELLIGTKWSYLNILPKRRSNNKFSIVKSMLICDWRVFQKARINRFDIMIGTSAEISHIGKLLCIPSIVVNEEDSSIVPLFAKAAYPWASYILAPNCSEVGKWHKKKIGYEGYHELAYLHPNYFKPERNLIKQLFDGMKKYFILRLVKQGAHHDSGRQGITSDIVAKLLEMLLPHGKVYITSERELEREFKQYQINIDPDIMHHALYFADMYIGDSQTMAAEAAVLGTPSIRFNDFVGDIGYLEELENRYGLTFGIRTSGKENLFRKVNELLNNNSFKDDLQKRRIRMLQDKIDVTAFITWLIDNYPKSVRIMKKTPVT